MSRLVVCSIGHVTDPDATLQASTGRPLDPARGYATGDICGPRPIWWTECRHVSVTKYKGNSPYQCRRRVIGPLDQHPDLEAAHRLGGAPAVQEIFMARHQGRDK